MTKRTRKGLGSDENGRLNSFVLAINAQRYYDTNKYKQYGQEEFGMEIRKVGILFIKIEQLDRWLFLLSYVI